MAESAIKEDEFLIQHEDFTLKEEVTYPNGGTSRFYENGVDMVIIDNNICDVGENEAVFSYMLITDKQNHYMHQYRRVFRFLGYFGVEVDKYLNSQEFSMLPDYTLRVNDRSEQADVSPLELRFEQNFSNVYGMNALKYLSREYGICDEQGNSFFLDYLVNTPKGKVAVEENGVNYHHPQIIGKDRYKNQLRKQNTCALWGIKLFRFSTEDCAFDNRIEDDIKEYFGNNTKGFIADGLKVERKVELYEHQTLSLEEIQSRRNNGIKAFLVVLPTAAGKSRIVEEDIKVFAQNKPDFKGLILVPGVNTLSDWQARVKDSLPEFEGKIDVCTYAYMAKHYMEKSSDYYKYLVVDEVQFMPRFEEVLNSLLRISNIDVYVTGSNSKFLSSDIVTEFRGRGDEIRIYPLSFAEFYAAYDVDYDDAWEEYMIYGGLPQVAQFSVERQKAEYLKNIFTNVYIKDVVERNRIQNVDEIGTLVDILASAIGAPTNPTKISNTFRSERGINYSNKTISNHIDYLAEAFLISKADRYDIKGRKYVGANLKYYFSDVGLRNARLNFRQQEPTHIMENIVYNELLVRGYNVDVGIVDVFAKNSEGKRVHKQLEVDFVVSQGSQRYYIQVAYDMTSEEKQTQELNSLRNIPDSFKKIVIVNGTKKPWRNEEGFVIMGMKYFLLNEDSLEF